MGLHKYGSMHDAQHAGYKDQLVQATVVGMRTRIDGGVELLAKQSSWLQAIAYAADVRWKQRHAAAAAELQCMEGWRAAAVNTNTTQHTREARMEHLETTTYT
jgi:hypothetical protein